jgi:type IV secretion system protein VirB10
MPVDLPAQPPAADTASAVAGPRSKLTARQKVGIFSGIGALALAAVVLTHLGGSATKEPDLGNNRLAGMGMPYSAPAATRPVPKPAPAPVAPSPPVSFAMPSLLPRQGSPADKSLTAPIFAFGGASGARSDVIPAKAARGNPSGQPGARDALSRALTPSDLGAPARARMLPHPDMTVPAGTLIPCTLQTAINSQLAGFVDCVLPAAVRGATGAITLLDRGTQVMGEIRSGLFQGQDRLFILWLRARTPDNVVITLASPAADELGRSGVPGAVNNHFWQRFGAAIMFSVIGAGPQIAASALQNGNGNSYVQFLSPQQQLANTVLESQINIPPTLEKNQGDNVTIFVARDLDFSDVYDLRTAP